ncbi:hypothetical protein SERLA73DRAFT_182813 [Serpula lacrymans var. lacrymans S7.3]|uniref:N-acetyltransferase domain-containing protein n=2 Tax=Serpula lacrymans var. lacrymans TaxID=341189 RepID=F8Q117_SERL3|nr:uncharacterized protein SERLADRAFT_469655 [Serpula lacrymans var. lacrymans S7.9]EGN97995.1 hypothetical protein SERLA73DRAFT_182813 [Serpula lacrymans var. lacrymans S7.3]EGO23587.1 hypothetical protein SERLADRAFT_469655 [Serpula lacrymans var. lacrymans S7.9]
MDDILQLWNDPLVLPSATSDTVVPHSPKFKDVLRETFEKAAIWVIITLKETGEFMGYSCIHIIMPKNRNGMFGVCLLPQYWDKGYGTEASKFVVDHSFRWLNLHRVSLDVHGDNPRAIAVYQKLGFVVEGRIREAVWKDNVWVDNLSMGVLRTEWAAQHWKK